MSIGANRRLQDIYTSHCKSQDVVVNKKKFKLFKFVFLFRENKVNKNIFPHFQMSSLNQIVI